MRIEFAKGEMTNMKRLTKIVLGTCLIILMVISYIVGSQMKEHEMRRNRSQQCNTLISFAIDKAENHDLANQDIMEALISNVYAAYQFCDDSPSWKPRRSTQQPSAAAPAYHRDP